MSEQDIGVTNEQDVEPKTKTFTQEEVNAIVARTKTKALKQYEDLGDPEELRSLKQQAEDLKREQALKRGEFDKVLQEKLSIKDKEIQEKDTIIRGYKIDLPLINAAAEFKSVNPDQVKALLKGQIKLNQEGDVEVVDQKGATRYDDKGVPLSVKDLVKSFLDSNPHFVQATPTGANSKNSFDSQGSEVDVSKMSDAQYAKYRKEHGIGR